LIDESDKEEGYLNLKWLCSDAIRESRLDILPEVLQRANEEQLECLRYDDDCFDLYRHAASCGKLFRMFDVIERE